MSRKRQPRRAVVFVVTLCVALCASLLPLATAGCASSPQAKAGEQEAVERLRTLTRNDVLPAEAVVSNMETEFAGTRAGALARVVRARVRLAANDFAGAASLLDERRLQTHTSIGDYVLSLRAQALAQANRRVEARAAYEQLARSHPSSPRARDASLRNAELALQDKQAAAVPLLLKKLADEDDAAALLLTAQAYEQQGDTARALAAYRRLHFYAPASDQSADAAAALTRLARSAAPGSPDEARERADRLYAAGRYTDAAAAYGAALGAFPASVAAPAARLRHGLSLYNAGAARTAEAVSVLNSVPASAGDARAEALYHLAQAYARQRQWAQARAATDEMRRSFQAHALTKRALTAVGLAAKEAKNTVEATNSFRTAVTAYPAAAEVAQAQFELAWAAHEARDFQESSRLLVEHLADYADKNTDNRGRAGYWAGRDLERAGRTREARTIYEAMQQRYDANWYGSLARQRLEQMPRPGTTSGNGTSDNAQRGQISEETLGRAVRNLGRVVVAEEGAGPEADAVLQRADELDAVGLDDFALAELDAPLAAAPRSPRLNLAKARVYRSQGNNLQALVTLQKSYPDYSQMKPEEMSREAWDVFYPLEHWEIIKREAKAKNLDPYRVAGLIRQESVFNPRASSSANAYGLMQLLLETAQRTARKYGYASPSSPQELFNPRLNIQLGTAYLRDQLDRFGRIEYVAAAYNAGPGRAARWVNELPRELDEWAEAVPFKETRGYVQGVVRNTLQYQRLYDEQGRFRAEVGARVVQPARASQAAEQPAQGNTRPRRAAPEEEEREER